MIGLYDQFGASMMARCELFLTPLFRKAQLKSRGDIGTARGRMLAYAQRSPGVRQELVRRAIGKADFAAGSTAQASPPKSDIRPFTGEKLAAYQTSVQKAAERAIVDGAGDQDATRMAMWHATEGDTDLAHAVAALLILAQL